jgi:excisionase family DNA binding protein
MLTEFQSKRLDRLSGRLNGLSKDRLEAFTDMIEDNMRKDVYTVNEAAELLGLHHNTVRKWCREGEIKAMVIGREYRISRIELERYWKARGGGELFEHGSIEESQGGQ